MDVAVVTARTAVATGIMHDPEARVRTSHPSHPSFRFETQRNMRTTCRVNSWSEPQLSVDFRGLTVPEFPKATDPPTGSPAKFSRLGYIDAWIPSTASTESVFEAGQCRFE